jgi:hypothetical protein
MLKFPNRSNCCFCCCEDERKRDGSKEMKGMKRK